MSDERRETLRRLEAISAIRDARCYSKSEKLVLVMLISHAGSDGSCYPSLDLLAEECRMARSVVAEAVATLVKNTTGPLRVTYEHQGRRDGSGGRGPNRYRLELSPTGGRKPRRVTSGRRTQPSGDLSPEMGGLESGKSGLESARRTGSSPEEPHQKKHTRDLAPVEPVQTQPAGFALEPQQPEKAKPDPNVTVLRDWHRTEHTRLRGTEPKYTSNQHAAAGKAWKELLGIRSVEEAKAIITAALTDGFAVDPGVILKMQNKFAARVAAPRNGRLRYRPQDTTPELENLGRAEGAGLVGDTAIVTAAKAAGGGT